MLKGVLVKRKGEIAAGGLGTPGKDPTTETRISVCTSDLL